MCSHSILKIESCYQLIPKAFCVAPLVRVFVMTPFVAFIYLMGLCSQLGHCQAIVMLIVSAELHECLPWISLISTIPGSSAQYTVAIYCQV